MADHPGEELFQAALATAKKNLKHDPRVLLDVANFIERHENAIRSIRAPSQEQTVRIASKAARLARPFYSGSRSSALDEAIACAEAPFGGTGGPDVGAAKRAAGSAQVESERAAGLRPGSDHDLANMGGRPCSLDVSRHPYDWPTLWAGANAGPS